MQYKVIRAYPGAEANAILDESEFISPTRIRQLVDLRYLEPVSAPAVPAQELREDGQKENPLVAFLVDASIRELRPVVSAVKDAHVLEMALEQDQRKVAKTLYADRLGELRQHG